MDKTINLNHDDRFVDANLLRNSYLTYEESSNIEANNYVSLLNDLELGIVSSHVPEIARAISAVLSCSLEDGKSTNGGYLPPRVVERVQTEIISPFGVSELWGTTGHRFVMSRPVGNNKREIIASILIGRSKDAIFFFTGRYNNIRHSLIKETVDLQQSADGDPNHLWFDKFNFPNLEVFKPRFYHQVANFVVNRECRGRGFARMFLENIVKFYSRDFILQNKLNVEHSQYLLCGKGFWQIGDPPWLPKMQALGFYLRGGAENFFIEQEWDRLQPIVVNDRQMSNVEYNESFDLPKMYENIQLSNKTNEHLLDRIPQVIELSRNPNAKLQYFQVMYNFI